MAKDKKILLIDSSGHDEYIISELLLSKNYEVIKTDEPKKALEMIFKDPDKFSLIFLGSNINNFSKIDLVHLINRCSKAKILPIIIHAMSNDPENINNYTKAGVRYYLPHDFDDSLFFSIIDTAIRDNARYSIEQTTNYKQEHIFDSIEELNFKFKTLEEGQSISYFIAQMCPNPTVAAIGISELFINAVEHGNLNISYDEKSQLHKEDRWLDEVNNRLNSAENRDKYVEAKLIVTRDQIKLKVKDQGKGFNWQDYQELNTNRVHDNHGRGIIMAKSLTFSEVNYIGCGNEVECTIEISSNNKASLSALS